MSPVMVTVLPALIFFFSKTIEAYKREKPFFFDRRLREREEKAHTCQSLCCSLFLLLSAESRSDLIKTEKELVRAENENEVEAGRVRLVPPGWWRKRMRMSGPQCIFPCPCPFSLPTECQVFMGRCHIKYVDVKRTQRHTF